MKELPWCGISGQPAMFYCIPCRATQRYSEDALCRDVVDDFELFRVTHELCGSAPLRSVKIKEGNVIDEESPEKISAMHLGPEAWGEALERLESYLEKQDLSNYVVVTLLISCAARAVASMGAEEEEVEAIVQKFRDDLVTFKEQTDKEEDDGKASESEEGKSE